MNSGRFMLTQILDLVHRQTLDRLVERYDAQSRVKHFGCRQQLICMAFAQLTWREGLSNSASRRLPTNFAMITPTGSSASSVGEKTRHMALNTKKTSAFGPAGGFRTNLETIVTSLSKKKSSGSGRSSRSDLRSNSKLRMEKRCRYRFESQPDHPMNSPLKHQFTKRSFAWPPNFRLLTRAAPQAYVPRVNPRCSFGEAVLGQRESAGPCFCTGRPA